MNLNDIQLTVRQKQELADWLYFNNDSCAITGSMYLWKLGIDIGREPGDIDILIRDNGSDIRDYITIPPFAEEAGIELSDGYVVLARYICFGIKIEFLAARDEEGEELNNPETLLGGIIARKREYVSSDTNQATKDKHAKDIEAIEEWLDKNRESLRQKYPWEL